MKVQSADSDGRFAEQKGRNAVLADELRHKVPGMFDQILPD